MGETYEFIDGEGDPITRERPSESATLYRKKPVVIEAMRLTKDSVCEVAKWCHGEGYFVGTAIPRVSIKTLEGTMQADVGDWVIKGVQGEFYPCRPAIFEATYEAVE